MDSVVAKRPKSYSDLRKHLLALCTRSPARVKAFTLFALVDWIPAPKEDSCRYEQQDLSPKPLHPSQGRTVQGSKWMRCEVGDRCHIGVTHKSPTYLATWDVGDPVQSMHAASICCQLKQCMYGMHIFCSCVICTYLSIFAGARLAFSISRRATLGTANTLHVPSAQ